MRKIVFALLALLSLVPMSLGAQTIDELYEQIPIPEGVDEMKVVFRFAEGVTDLQLGLSGNQDALDSICMVMNPKIVEKGTVLVDGYGSDIEEMKVRCKKVKSELVTLIGMKEENFTTTIRMATYNGRGNVVVVTVPSNVMASAMRDFEIMRILSTPRIIEVVEYVTPEEVAEPESEEVNVPFEEVEEQPAVNPSGKVKLHYAKSIYQTKRQKRKAERRK